MFCTDSSAAHLSRFRMCDFQIQGGDTFWLRPLNKGQNTVFWWYWEQIQEFSKKLNLVFCSRSVRLIWVINHCCTLKTQGGDTFWKNNSVIFVSTFLIGRAIRHFWFIFRMQDFCSNISERGNVWSDDLYFCYNWSLKTPFLP